MAAFSAQRLRALERSLGAQLLFSHDHEQHEQLPRFPSAIASRPVAEEAV